MRTGDKVRCVKPPTFARWIAGDTGTVIETVEPRDDRPYYIVHMDETGYLCAFTADEIEPEHAMQAVS